MLLTHCNSGVLLYLIKSVIRLLSVSVWGGLGGRCHTITLPWAPNCPGRAFDPQRQHIVSYTLYRIVPERVFFLFVCFTKDLNLRPQSPLASFICILKYLSDKTTLTHHWHLEIYMRQHQIEAEGSCDTKVSVGLFRGCVGGSIM